MSALSDKQRKFPLMVAKLLEWIYEQGYEVTFGDAFRDPRLHGEMGVRGGYGAANSCHKQKLAIDLNLFKNGNYLPGTEDHLEIGQRWESMGGTWGGRFKDGNHYSLEHEEHK